MFLFACGFKIKKTHSNIPAFQRSIFHVFTISKAYIPFQCVRYPLISVLICGSLILGGTVTDTLGALRIGQEGDCFGSDSPDGLVFMLPIFH